MSDSIGASSALSSSSSYSAAINSAVANQGSTTSTTSTTTTTSVTSSTDAVTDAEKKQLKELGISTTNISTGADAKKAIAKAQKGAVEKAAELSGSGNSSSDEIKDTVEISSTAQKLGSSSAAS